MKNRVRILGIVAVVAIIGLSVTGCGTTTGTSLSRETGWSHQTVVPSKDYKVVGVVIVKNTTEQMVIADLMEEAKAAGGHDIINVRMTKTVSGLSGKITIDNATAVVIQYTDETLMSQTGNAVVNADGTTVTNNTTTQYVGISERGSSDSGLLGSTGRLFGKK